MTPPVSQPSLVSSALSSVEVARAQTLSDIPVPVIEEIPIAEGLGRVLAEDIVAAQALPPEAVSAMDGYAVISSDVTLKGARLRVIGMAPAGGRFDGTVKNGEAVRIFTGGPIPPGCDRVVIQEEVTPLPAPCTAAFRTSDKDPDKDPDTDPHRGPHEGAHTGPDPVSDAAEAKVIEIPAAQTGPAHIRNAGIDFEPGDILVPKSTRIGLNLPGLIAAANYARLRVYKKPRIGILSSGDELVAPGSPIGPGQIVNSAAFGLHALCRHWGADPRILGILSDDIAAATQQLQAIDPAGYEGLVTLGGASVGDRDLVKPALSALGAEIELEKVAVKPGKPYWTGRLGGVRLIGLPGNPSSAFVCAHLFLKPLIYALSGRQANEAITFLTQPALTSLPANGDRESYLRAVITEDRAGGQGVSLLPAQDSSLLSSWSRATCLVRRAPGAPRIEAGDIVPVLPLD